MAIFRPLKLTKGKQVQLPTLKELKIPELPKELPKITPNIPTLKQSLPLVTISTPTATSPDQVRGIFAPIQHYYFSNRPGLAPRVTQNRFFKLFFFPPDHFLGFFRKSKPALRVKYDDGYIANDPSIGIGMKGKSERSLMPADYSVVRLKMRRLVRTEFLKSYNELNGRDGLYVFHLNLLPKKETMEEFKKELKDSIEKTKSFNCSKIVLDTNRKVNFTFLRRLIDHERLIPPKELADFEMSINQTRNKTQKSPENGTKKRKELKKAND